eukprot:g81497.t1
MFVLVVFVAVVATAWTISDREGVTLALSFVLDAILVVAWALVLGLHCLIRKCHRRGVSFATKSIPWLMLANGLLSSLVGTYYADLDPTNTNQLNDWLWRLSVDTCTAFLLIFIALQQPCAAAFIRNDLPTLRAVLSDPDRKEQFFKFARENYLIEVVLLHVQVSNYFDKMSDPNWDVMRALADMITISHTYFAEDSPFLGTFQEALNKEIRDRMLNLTGLAQNAHTDKDHKELREGLKQVFQPVLPSLVRQLSWLFKRFLQHELLQSLPRDYLALYTHHRSISNLSPQAPAPHSHAFEEEHGTSWLQEQGRPEQGKESLNGGDTNSAPASPPRDSFLPHQREDSDRLSYGEANALVEDARIMVEWELNRHSLEQKAQDAVVSTKKKRIDINCLPGSVVGGVEMRDLADQLGKHMSDFPRSDSHSHSPGDKRGRDLSYSSEQLHDEDLARDNYSDFSQASRSPSWSWTDGKNREQSYQEAGTSQSEKKRRTLLSDFAGWYSNRLGLGARDDKQKPSQRENEGSMRDEHATRPSVQTARRQVER